MRLISKNKTALTEFVRFVVVGIIATAIHYGVYCLLLFWINTTIAYSVGYAVSFVCNFCLTTLFTFHSKASVKKGFGFSIAHGINYLLHIIFLNLFLWIGVPKLYAPFIVFSIVIPVNFLLVKLVFKKF